MLGTCTISSPSNVMLGKGILLIATGHPYYGNMAHNLACSIKSVEDIPIAVVWSDSSLSHLDEKQLAIFDHKIELPDGYRTGFGVKLHLDELTPFDRTLALDVDMLWLGHKPTELIDTFAGKFCIITEGDSANPNPKYYFWAELAELQQVFSVEHVYQTRSEVIYFEKGCQVFSKAREVDCSKLKTIRKFGEWIPDELYFNIAIAQLGLHVPAFMPAYWPRLYNELMPNLAKLYREYYLLSFGSNAASPVMKRAYDNVMRVVCGKLKIPYLFKMKSKKEWAPGRLKI